MALNMALKTTIAAGFAALSMAFLTGAAEAKTKVVIGIGTPGWYHGGYCYNHPYRCRPAPRAVYYNYHVNPGPVIYYNNRAPLRGKMSCNRARNLVDDSGFNRVNVRECGGSVYTFTGMRNGNRFVVKVDAFARRIVGVGRI
jgi:hypothetical protein